MKFNEKTRAQLAILKTEMPHKAQDILSSFGHYDSDCGLPTLKNRMLHTCRVAIYIPALFEFCLNNGIIQENSITEEEITLLQYVVFYSGYLNKQQNDTRLRDRVRFFHSFLNNNKIQDEKAQDFSRYITGQKKDILNTILETAFILDGLCHNLTLELETVPLFTELYTQKARDQFVKFTIKVAQFIANQNELKSDSYYITYRKEWICSSENNKDEARQTYEQPPILYTKMSFDWQNLSYEDCIKSACIWGSYSGRLNQAQSQVEQKEEPNEISDNSLLEKVLKEAEISLSEDKKSVLFCFSTELYATRFILEVKKKLFGDWFIDNLTYTHEISTETLTPFSVQISTEQLSLFEAEMRLDTPRLNSSDDYVVKSLPADHCSTNDYIEMIVPVQGETKKHSLRRGDKGGFTVTGQGVFQRPLFSAEDKHEQIETKTEYPIKSSQYSSRKKGFSKALPASQGTADFWVTFTNHSDNPAQNALAGTMIYSPDYLHSDRLFLQLKDASDRLDFNTSDAAYRYFYENHKQCWEYSPHKKILFSSAEIADFREAISRPRNRNLSNVVFIRQQWNIKTSRVIIGDTSLESTLHAVEIARLIKKYLFENKLVAANYEVPIIYYIPNELDFHLKPFSILEYRLSRLKAQTIHSDKTLRLEKYTQKKYQFLLQLNTKEIEEALLEPISQENKPKLLGSSKPKVFESLAERLLYSGYIDILEGLADKLKQPLQFLINNYCDIDQKTSPFGWYHLLRCRHYSEAATLLAGQKAINFDEEDDYYNSVALLATKQNDYELFEKVYRGIALQKDASTVHRQYSDRFIYAAITYNQSLYLRKVHQLIPHGSKMKNLTLEKNALVKGNLAMLKVLDTIIKMDKTAIEIAFEQKRYDAVAFFINQTPELLNRKVSSSEVTPLFLAIQADHLELVQFMLEKGARVDVVSNDQGNTPLTYAFCSVDRFNPKSKRYAIIRLLLAKPDNEQSMIWSLKWSNTDLQKLLIQQHPSLIETMFEDKTALLWAALRKDKSMVRFLLDQKASTTSVFNYYQTRYYTRTDNDNENEIILKFLLKNGLELSALNPELKGIQNAQALFIELLNYIIDRRAAGKFTTSYKFPFFSKSAEFGYSQHEKLSASVKMKDVILGLAKPQELQSHRGPLNTGNFVALFARLIPVFTNFGLHAFKDECTVKAKRVVASLIPN